MDCATDQNGPARHSAVQFLNSYSPFHYQIHYTRKGQNPLTCTPRFEKRPGQGLPIVVNFVGGNELSTTNKMGTALVLVRPGITNGRHEHGYYERSTM